MQDLFPYEEERDQQDEMIEVIGQALDDEGAVVAHAPTGLGKTAASVAPALADALENDRTVFFVTPRHSQHAIALETLREIREEHNERFTSVDLIGKRWLCEGARQGHTFLEEEEENPCPRHDETYENGHQLTDRARRVKNRLSNKIMTAEETREACEKVCPYEILMNMAAEADIVIGDYFHIFHPGVRDAIFSKSGMSLSDCTVIVDEAHNLAERTRSLNSAHLTEDQLKDAVKEASRFGFYDEEEKLQRLAGGLKDMAREELGMESESKVSKGSFLAVVNDIVSEYDHLVDDLEDVAEEVTSEEEESVCAEVAEFLDRWPGTDKGFVRVLKKVQRTNRTYLKLSYTCLDPQYATRSPLAQSHCSVCMSGTLTPVEMYREIFGLDEEETLTETFTSPFPEENKLNLIVDRVTTKYTERDDSMYQKMAWYILQSAEQNQGNMGVFFPSYKMRDQVYEKMADRADFPVFEEDRRMNKEEKEEFLQRFGEKTDDGAVLLGVIGGSFGEGVDYPGDLMSTVMVVGIPLQRPGLETKALIEFYDDRFGKGWDYGYNFPAINRALQAAGRCIRSSDDRGVVVFMDERYRWSKYRKALPPEDYRVTSAPWKEIGEFFGTE